ncbi:recombinase family protein [Halorussus salinus]|uniref:recombinase family protein n=1 Tax=Halorussus salinus TaxID=1364935 RepID=UPI0010920D90|nr:recombinase family protein [Halorussus salinus]
MIESHAGLGQVTSEQELSRAAIYVRTSSGNQQYGYSIEEQVRQCTKRCEFLGWDIVYIFRDRAESGKDTERPMFQRMMQAAKTGCFDVVVFWKLDRFSRSLLHAVQLEKTLRECGVALHSVTEQIDTTTSAGRFNFRNIANAAEFEREMISERSQMGLKALASEYRWPNDHPPLGYRRTSDGTLEVDDTEANLVEEIFEMYLDRQSMPEVAHELNNNGLSTKTDGEWTHRAVRDVLTNDLYIGVYAVAGVKDYVPEYRIISKNLFKEAISVRHRFNSESTSQRPEMGAQRKSKNVDAILEKYKDFVNR